MMDCSIVKEHERGMRRYFPLTSTVKDSDEMAAEVVSIFTGKEQKDLFKIRSSYVFNRLEEKVEQFDGWFWVRTVYRISQ